MNAPSVLGEVHSYSDLHGILRRRAEQLELSRECIDFYSGLQPGYSSKLLSPNPTKRIGPLALTLLLPTLGAKLLVVEDPEALARLRSNSGVKPRSAQHSAHAKVVMLSGRHFRRIGKKGGALSRSKMSKQQASEIGRKAAVIRWSAVKAAARGG